jgi:hypothetical protein
MEQRRIISNVNILDLRQATEASVAQIGEIGNANVVLYTAETAGLLQRLNIGNVNASVEVPADAQVKPVVGQALFNRTSFQNLAAPQYPLVIGQVLVEPDVPAEDVEKGLSGLVVIGQVICPEHLLGVLQAKPGRVIGQVKAYPRLGRVHLDSLILDEDYLCALEDGTELAVVGSLRVPQVLPTELLERKLARLFVSGKTLCHEENALALHSRLLPGSGKVRTIPAGFELVERPLVLDRALLGALAGKKLYCTERVQVAADVEAAMLEKSLGGLVCKELLLCPAALGPVMAGKCNLLETQAVFYEGTLWLEENSSTLTSARFDYLEGQATLVVTGAVTVDPQVDPQVLAGRLARVHNLGCIRCTPEQAAALRSRLGLAEGSIDEGTGEAEEGAEGRVSNANYLAL